MQWYFWTKDKDSVIILSAELQQSGLQQAYHNAYVSLYKALGGWITKEELASTAESGIPAENTMEEKAE